jgi:hypothetical protein
MSLMKFPVLARFFLLALAGFIILANVAIVLKSRPAELRLAGISSHLSEQKIKVSASGAELADHQSALSQLESDIRAAEKSLAQLKASSPRALVDAADDRVRALLDGVEATTKRMAEFTTLLEPQGAQKFTPRIFYAEYDVTDEYVELSGPPNTLMNPAIYSFSISYSGRLFPERNLGAVARGDIFWPYKLEVVTVETRQGEIVKDKIVRHRRRKGGVREPVWSYRRLPSRQVVVLQLSNQQESTQHVIHYPSSEDGANRRIQREVPFAWIEAWESEDQKPSRFPVMRASEFTWGDTTYLVKEVTPQEIKLTAKQSGETTVWRFGSGR